MQLLDQDGHGGGALGDPRRPDGHGGGALGDDRHAVLQMLAQHLIQVICGIMGTCHKFNQFRAPVSRIMNRFKETETSTVSRKPVQLDKIIKQRKGRIF